MTAWPVFEDFPPGYEILEGTIGVLAVSEQARGDILGAGFGPDGGEDLEPSDLSGRTRLDTLPLSDGGRGVLRRFTHGGLARIVTGERYADPQRPFRELVLAARLKSLGLSVPQVLAARAIRRKPFGWQLSLVTRRVEGVSDLALLLEAWRGGAGTHRTHRALIREVGQTIGHLHRVGFLHADLHPRNLLLDADILSGTAASNSVTVIDLDRSLFTEPLSESQRQRNLARFVRAVQKRERRGSPFLTRGDALRFLLSYREGLGGNRGPQAWKRDWRRLKRIGASTRWLHRLGWSLERVLGKGPESRDGDAWVRARPLEEKVDGTG